MQDGGTLVGWGLVCPGRAQLLPAPASGRGYPSLLGLPINRLAGGGAGDNGVFVRCSLEARTGCWCSHESSVIKSIREGICANKETGAGARPVAGAGGSEGWPQTAPRTATSSSPVWGLCTPSRPPWVPAWSQAGGQWTGLFHVAPTPAPAGPW